MQCRSWKPLSDRKKKRLHQIWQIGGKATIEDVRKDGFTFTKYQGYTSWSPLPRNQYKGIVETLLIEFQVETQEQTLQNSINQFQDGFEGCQNRGHSCCTLIGALTGWVGTVERQQLPHSGLGQKWLSRNPNSPESVVSGEVLLHSHQSSFCDFVKAENQHTQSRVMGETPKDIYRSCQHYQCGWTTQRC